MIEAHPEYAGPLYNLACCESLAGRTDDAIRHLRLAIDRKESFRSLAAEDSDFDPIRDEAAFKELVQGNAAEPTTGSRISRQSRQGTSPNADPGEGLALCRCCVRSEARRRGTSRTASGSRWRACSSYSPSAARARRERLPALPSSSTSRRAAAQRGSNGSSTTRPSSTRQIPATNPSTRNVCATSPFTLITVFR